ncbi:MAG: hypothetical protein HY023_11775 [Chloroflexi bacterium]|nr:hypothetical protein [Chloroflexota bacterium]
MSQAEAEAALESPVIASHLSGEIIESLFEYRRHVGLCGEFVDRALSMGREEKAKEDR